MYNNSIILGASYDGNIYAFDKKSKENLNHILGFSGKPLLHFDISDNKVSFLTLKKLFNNLLMQFKHSFFFFF